MSKIKQALEKIEQEKEESRFIFITNALKEVEVIKLKLKEEEEYLEKLETCEMIPSHSNSSGYQPKL